MKTKSQLSNNTKTYMERYQRILYEMTEHMSSTVLTDSISGSFIIQMIPHHRAAIEMSENLLKYTTNIPLQNIAQSIISSQTESIEDMLLAYPKCQFVLNTQQDLCTYSSKNLKILNNMFHEMGSACTTNQIDCNFIREMIPHHRGAVLMSENALHYPLCPELVPILEAIISSQIKGIQQMQQLLKKVCC